MVFRRYISDWILNCFSIGFMRRNTQLLEIEPKELKFLFELKKRSSCSLRLTNNSSDIVAFKVKTTSPNRYGVQPVVGIVLPKSTSELTVKTIFQNVVAADMVCEDKFLIQSTVVPVGTAAMDITPLMFSKDGGKFIEEVKLKVRLINPHQPPPVVLLTDQEIERPFSDRALLKDQVLKKRVKARGCGSYYP